MPLHVSSTCGHHQEVKIVLHSLWYHHTYRCVMQFWPPDDEHICSKHVEPWNKLIVKQKFCASSWLITEINFILSSEFLYLPLTYLFCIFKYFFLLWRCGPTRVRPSSFVRFLDHTQRRITVGRTPLEEWSARRRDLYLTTHNTHNRQTSMPSVGFEPTFSAGERPQTYALDCVATETGILYIYISLYIHWTQWGCFTWKGPFFGTENSFPSCEG